MTQAKGRRSRSRANGEGTVYKRTDGRWTAAFVDERGQRHAWYRKTRMEAEKKLREERDNQDKGLPVIDGTILAPRYLEEWLEMVERTVRPSTWKKYSSLLKNHVIRFLKGVPLRKLTGQTLDRLYTDAHARGLSRSSCETLHVVLHRALADACRKHLVHRNVADEASPFRSPRREMKTLSQSEAMRLLDAARGDELEALYVLALLTGMRQGELLGLRWKDVDLVAGHVSVTATLQRGKGAGVAEPKTKQSRRRISLATPASEALKQQREKVQSNCEWVFPTASGGPWDPRNLVRRGFEPLLKRAGLPRIRFHDLRHTFCTIMLEIGVHPKIVSEMAGHASIAITLDLYSHAVHGIHALAADMLGEALSSGERKELLEVAGV